MLSVLLFGGLIVQACAFVFHTMRLCTSNHPDFYYTSFPNDRYKVKGLVVSIVLIESVQIVFIFVVAYQNFASGWGNPSVLSYWLESGVGVFVILGGLREFYCSGLCIK